MCAHGTAENSGHAPGGGVCDFGWRRKSLTLSDPRPIRKTFASKITQTMDAEPAEARSLDSPDRASELMDETSTTTSAHSDGSPVAERTEQRPGPTEEAALLIRASTGVSQGTT